MNLNIMTIYIKNVIFEKLWVMQDKQNGFIGLNVFSYWFVPLTNSTEDKIATQRANDFYFGW